MIDDLVGAPAVVLQDVVLLCARGADESFGYGLYIVWRGFHHALRQRVVGFVVMLPGEEGWLG